MWSWFSHVMVPSVRIAQMFVDPTETEVKVPANGFHWKSPAPTDDGLVGGWRVQSRVATSLPHAPKRG